MIKICPLATFHDAYQRKQSRPWENRVDLHMNGSYNKHEVRLSDLWTSTTTWVLWFLKVRSWLVCLKPDKKARQNTRFKGILLACGWALFNSFPRSPARNNHWARRKLWAAPGVVQPATSRSLPFTHPQNEKNNNFIRVSDIQISKLSISLWIFI